MDNYFSHSYQEANERFQHLVGRKKWPLERYAIGIDDLEICVTMIGSQTADNLVVHTSGMHGVEAYVGSAIQLRFLTEFDRVPENTCLLMVHVVNPYGMKHGRRFNENNVDLNRNFIDFSKNKPQKNEKYRALNSLLNPKKQSELRAFKFKALLKILKHGFPSLQQAVAQGQYRYPKGLFYGGERLEKSTHIMLGLFKNHQWNPRHVVALDVHAGLGKFNTEGLFLEGFQSKADYEYLQKLTDASIIHVQAQAKNAYKIEGGYVHKLAQIFPNANFYGLTQEFGIAKPLDVLSAFRRENCTHHYHSGKDIDFKHKSDLKNMFCPEDINWRKNALNCGVTRLNQLLLI